MRLTLGEQGRPEQGRLRLLTAVVAPGREMRQTGNDASQWGRRSEGDGSLDFSR